MKIISIANQKGGVGKTTTALNLSHIFSLLTPPILLVDLDPQANASSGLGVSLDSSLGTYGLLSRQKEINECISYTAFPGLKILAGNPLLISLTAYQNDPFILGNILKNNLSQIKDSYHYIVVDCPPSYSPFSLAALIVADSVIIPIQCEYFAMEGLSQMLHLISEIQANYNSKLEIEGILLTLFDEKLQFCREVAAEIKSHMSHRVYRTIIPRDVTLAEATSFGLPILEYAPTSRGARGYIELAKEIWRNEHKKGS